MKYFYADRRVGCASCNWVADTGKVIDEEELHQEMCPHCGDIAVHHYPVIGSWPSDYDVPPCRELLPTATSPRG